MWFGLNRLSVSLVAVAMKSDLEVCPHCRKAVRLSSDVGVIFHWAGNYFLIDVVLLVPEASILPVLYREVYVAESKRS